MKFKVAHAQFLVHVVVFCCGTVTCYDLMNVALGKSTFQSTSEYSDEGGPELAVDGNSNQNWGGGSCTHTRRAYGSYWEVDLGDIYVIDSVEIFNRIDTCCNDKLVGVQIYGGMNTASYDLFGYNSETVYTSYEFQMNQTIYAQWIRVTRSPDIREPLMLCEVKVMGYKPTFVLFKRVNDAAGTGVSLGTIFARSWEQCCHMCLKTDGCAAVELKDSLCTLLDSNSYEVTAGESIYKLN